MLSACNSTSQPSVLENIATNKLIENNTGWSVNSPLNNLYDYQLIDVRGEKPQIVDLTKSNGGLLDYDIVFIGENHRHPGNHLAQADIYANLLQNNDKIILSMEQFERDTQHYVDAYLNGEIGEWSLRHFARAWDNYQSSYRPLVEMAKQRGLPVIAANAPKDTVVCTGRNGLSVLEKLPEQRRHQIASSFHTHDHGAYFEKFAHSMGHGKKSTEKRNLNSYHAQVVRDDTMAESIVNALATHPDHKLVHLNGHFHSASGLGTVERVKLRKNNKIAVIQPILVSTPSNPSFSYEDIASGDFLLLIHPLPEQVITAENKKVWMNTVFKRSKQDCSFGTEK